MKSFKQIILALVTAASLALPAAALAADGKDEKKPKPYPLDVCVVADEKLDTDPAMKSHTFVHEGQEVKLCCKSCLKEFKKDTAKYMAKITAAQKKAK